MKQEFNIAERVLATAEQYPDRVAFRTQHAIVKYGRFGEMVLSHAFHMRSRGISRASRICITGEGPVAQVATALACALLGCSWVSGAAAAAHSELLGLTHVIHTGREEPPVIGRLIRIEPSWFEPQPVTADDFEGFASPDDIWSVMHSSGTTGATKYMPITAVAALRRFSLDAYDYVRDRPPVLGCLMPFLSAWGMEFVFNGLITGGTVVKSDDLKAMRDGGVTTVVGSPAQYLPLCEKSPPFEKKIMCGVIGGAHCSDQFFDRMLERFDLVQHAFGSTEMGRISFNRFGPGVANRRSVGKPIPSAAVEIVDDNDQPLPPMTTGALRMRSTAPIAGYVGGDSHALRGGWFYSGDTAFISPEGELTIVGRMDDLINVGGAKLDANALDDTIAAADGVKEGFCFLQRNSSGADELAVVIVPGSAGEAGKAVESVRTNLLAKFGRRATVRKIYVATAIPKNENGKIARNMLAKVAEESTPFVFVG